MWNGVRMVNFNVKPSAGNINLMISIEEVEYILSNMKEVNERSGYLRKTGEHTYILPNPRDEELDSKIVLFEKQELIRLLNAHRGLYDSKERTGIDNKKRFRIELTKKEHWRIA